MAQDRLPLTFDITSRKADITKDSRVVNAIVEGDEIVKRPGLITWATPTSGTGQGMFAWRNQIVAGVNNTL